MNLNNIDFGPLLDGLAKLHWIWLVVFWYTVFLINGILRGFFPRLRKGEDGRFHLQSWYKPLLKAWTIPLIITGLSILFGVRYLDCASEYNPPDICSNFDGRRGEESCISCDGVDVRTSAGKVRWIPTLWNAFGAQVLDFNIWALWILIFALGVGILCGIAWLCLAILGFAWALIASVAQFSWKHFPLRW